MSLDLKNTNEEVLRPTKNVPNSFLPYLSSIIANLGAFAIGISTCPFIMSSKSTIVTESDQESSLSQLYVIGGLIGAASALYLCDSMGPKRCIQITAFPLFTSRLVMGYCQTIYGFYAAKLLGGLAGGILSFAAINYATEIAETKRRGSTVLIQSIMFLLGSIFASFITINVDDFIFQALIPSLVPVIYLTALSFMPESPVYLWTKVDQLQARSTLQWLRGPDYNINDEIARIQKQTRTRNKSKWSQLFTINKATTLEIFIAITLLFFQFFFSLYTNDIISRRIRKVFVAFGNYDSMTLSITKFGALCLTIVFIDRIDRRKLLQTSFLMMSICVIIRGIAEKVSTSSIENWAKGIIDFAFGLIYYGGVFQVTIILMLDILDDVQTKGKAICLCLSFVWFLELISKHGNIFWNPGYHIETPDVNMFIGIGMCLVAFFFTKYGVTKVLAYKNQMMCKARKNEEV